MVEQSEHPRPEGGDVGARNLDLDRAAAPPGDDAPRAELALDGRRSAGVDADPRKGGVALGTELLRVARKRLPEVEPLRPGELVALTGDDGPVDPVDAVRARL